MAGTLAALVAEAGVMNELLLLVDHRHAEVTMDGGALRVRWPGARQPEHVPLGLLGQVVLLGNPHVELRALRALGERGIPTVLLPARGSGEGVWLHGGLGGGVAARIAQHRAHRTDRGLALARELVAAKIDAYAALARSRGWSDAAQAIHAPAAQLGAAGDLDTLMGLEGAAASAWWAAMAERVAPEWRFRGRNRRPPRDPVNALLSLGYTLLGAEVAAAVRAVGLDPAVGFLHGVVPGRDSLVLDLMEPLRAGVDAWVLAQLDARAVEPADFHCHATHGCRLRKAARGRIYAAWAEARMRWPDPTRPDDPLPAYCTHRARWLRERLGPYDPHTGAERHG